jgi:hypothetical protein
VLSGLAHAQAGVTPPPGGLDIQALEGLDSETAVQRILDELCPPGILDEEIARLAIGEALIEQLGAGTFDPAMIDANAQRQH